jgi:hypothetical protein
MVKMFYIHEKEYFAPHEYISYVMRFHELLPYIENKDINYYTSVNDLHLATVKGKEKKMEKEEKKAMKSQVNKLIDDDDFLLIEPLSYYSSCAYGGGTKWCTASRETDKNFKEITNDNYLFYLIDKHKKETHPLYKIAITVYKTDDKRIRVWNAPDKELNTPINHLLPEYILDKIRSHVKDRGVGVDIGEFVLNKLSKTTNNKKDVFKIFNDPMSGTVTWVLDGVDNFKGYKDFTIYATPFYQGDNILPINISFEDTERGGYIEDLNIIVPLNQRDKYLITNHFDEWFEDIYKVIVFDQVKWLLMNYEKVKKG